MFSHSLLPASQTCNPQYCLWKAKRKKKNSLFSLAPYIKIAFFVSYVQSKSSLHLRGARSSISDTAAILQDHSFQTTFPPIMYTVRFSVAWKVIWKLEKFDIFTERVKYTLPHKILFHQNTKVLKLLTLLPSPKTHTALPLPQEDNLIALIFPESSLNIFLAVFQK